FASGAKAKAAKSDAAPLPKGVADVAPADVQKLVTDGKAVVFDANSAETRTKFGSVPKATLLESSSDYSLDVLPKDKTTTLIFYCANPHCTASHSAAKRAVTAGYKDVRVMSVGIAGWKTAGMETEQHAG